MRAQASKDILNNSLGNGVSRGFQEVFSTVDARIIFVSLEYMQDWNNAIELSQVFQEIARFERFTDLNLLEYAFNVIQNWESYNFIRWCLLFVSSYGGRRSR